MVSGGVSTNHVGGAAQFLLCRNTTSRYFLPVKLLENFIIMSPPNNSTSKIQKILQYSSEWDAEGVVPYNPEFTANSKHRRTMFAPTSHSGKFLPPQNRSARCFILLYACNLLWSAMLITHYSFLISHSSLLTPHLTPLLI